MAVLRPKCSSRPFCCESALLGLRRKGGEPSQAIGRSRGGRTTKIHTRTSQRWKNCFSPALYRDHNAIDRMFCRHREFRRVAMRYDGLAANFLIDVCIAATVSYCL